MLRISTCLLLAVGCVLAAQVLPARLLLNSKTNQQPISSCLCRRNQIYPPIDQLQRFEANGLNGAFETPLNSQQQSQELLAYQPEQIAHLIEPVDMKNVEALADEHQWGVVKIQAPEAWQELGTLSGEGVIICHSGHWRHGTHTTGTIAGGKGIGVAPGAKWAACRGCASSACWQSDLLACGDFFACPTRADGSSPDCSKAPNVVSNSWEVVEETPAKIIPLFSNGNSGPSCNTANSPADQNVIAVGSTTIDDAISSFSSVGPTTDGRMKPEVSAPGSNVISAYHTSDTAYVSLSGTSMACPHAAGAIALLQVRDKNLSYVKAKEFLLGQTDKNLVSTGRTCEGIPDNEFPTTCLELDVSTPSRVSELKPLPCKAKSELQNLNINCTVSF
ncbi:Bacillopeptidase F [Orchesella cincta]|uniref:Bacillopeptidase F n=1 Tax=Orchesella cincta TaxID=48709 RepID=A0A1D2M7T2_ORCCI|nr:Bacillopeptidase F [Orchesella cincta]